MIEKKRREKVVAEITLAYLLQLAREAGISLTEEDALNFLNHDGRAYAMWKEMMHAGENYIKASLKATHRPIGLARASATRERMVI